MFSACREFLSFLSHVPSSTENPYQFCVHLAREVRFEVFCFHLPHAVSGGFWRLEMRFLQLAVSKKACGKLKEWNEKTEFYEVTLFESEVGRSS
jgi:hypothetical protein